MKKIYIGIAVLIITIAAALFFNIHFLSSKNGKDSVSAAAYYGSTTPITLPPEDGEKGTASNPFVILEIVPYEGYAEIGYMIQGCEPVPIDQAVSNGDIYTLVSTNGMTYNQNTNKVTYNNYFLKYVLDIDTSNPANVAAYKINVITITPDKLNLPCNFNLIDRADLIFFSPKLHVGSLDTIWEKYYPSMKKSTHATSFLTNDITWETTAEILRKTSVDDDPAPIVFDVTVFDSGSAGMNITPNKKYSNGQNVGVNDTGYYNNIAKLYMIMQQMEPVKFYNEFIKSGLVKAVPVKSSSGQFQYVDSGNTVKMTTGYYLEQDSAYNTSTAYTYNTANPAAIWCIYTFLPYQLFPDYNSLKDGQVWYDMGIDYNFSWGSKNVAVRHNFYSYNGDCALNQNFVDTTKVEYNSRFTQGAFDYYNMTSGKISPAMAIHFLVNSKPKYSDDMIRVLEVEPCNSFIWDGTSSPWQVGDNSTNGSSNSRLYFTKLFPNYNGSVAITTMTSPQFNASLEELNGNYDLIVFGLKSDALKSNGGLNYNDSSLNSKIYLHNGDKIKMSSNKLSGLPGSTDTDTFRYSGNDITKLKFDQLKSFMAAGNPILLDSGFFSSNNTSVDTLKIDSNSYIYSLANINKSTSPLFYLNTMTAYAIEGILTRTKIQLNLNSYPVVYRDRTKSAYSGYSDAQIYVNGNNINYRTLEYQFRINNKYNSSDNYTAKLYLDMNADGKFDSSEKLSGISILNASGSSVSSTGLKSGTDYTLKCNLEAYFTGILPWKLEIVSNTSSYIIASTSNYCALKTSVKKQINVLQITPDSGNTVNLTNSTFSNLFNKVNNYDIKVTQWTISMLKSKCGTGSYRYLLSDDNDDMGDTDGVDSIDDDNDNLYDFDIVILGFGSKVDYDQAGQNAISNIKEYITKGNTILFTNDSLSYVNSTDRSQFTNYWGYSMNQSFRNILGMDRFGATYSSASDRQNNKKDYASSSSDYSSYIQGYSNRIMNEFASTSSPWTHPSNPNAVFGSVNGNASTTNTITQINDGQVSRYPFEIDQKVSVAPTQAQYYQLDLEDSSISVWYCLSNSSSGGYYSTTPNDARNNYYVYNKGNITFTGIGSSSSVTDMEAKLFVNAMLATYTTAVQTPLINLTNKNISRDSKDQQYVYVDYDIYNTSQAYGDEVNKSADTQYQRIKFIITENNILLNKVLTLSYYVIKSDGTQVKITNITAKKLNDNSSVNKNSSGDIVTSGVEYYIDIPLSVLQDNKMLMNNNFGSKISIHGLMTYGVSSDKSKQFNQDFILARRGLFDLD